MNVVDVTQKGKPPRVPYPVVMEHDQKLATHTVYRPATLGPAKLPVVVWGEGACVKNGLSFPEFLSEIASYGFVVVADGPPVEQAARGADRRGAAPRNLRVVKPPRARRRLDRPCAPCGGVQAPPVTINADGTPLIAGDRLAGS